MMVRLFAQAGAAALLFALFTGAVRLAPAEARPDALKIPRHWGGFASGFYLGGEAGYWRDSNIILPPLVYPARAFENDDGAGGGLVIGYSSTPIAAGRAYLGGELALLARDDVRYAITSEELGPVSDGAEDIATTVHQVKEQKQLYSGRFLFDIGWMFSRRFPVFLRLGYSYIRLDDRPVETLFTPEAPFPAGQLTRRNTWLVAARSAFAAASPRPPAPRDSNNTHYFAVGVGGEYAFNKNLSLRGSFIYNYRPRFPLQEGTIGLVWRF